MIIGLLISEKNRETKSKSVIYHELILPYLNPFFLPILIVNHTQKCAWYRTLNEGFNFSCETISDQMAFELVSPDALGTYKLPK